MLFLRRARPRCGRVCHPTDPLPRQRAPRPNVAQTERAVVLTRAGLCRERYAPLLAIGRKNASSATILSRTAGANSEPLLALAGIGNSPKCPPSTARAALSMSRPRSFRLRPKKSICFHFRLLRAARRASSCSRRSRRPRSCIRFIRVNHFALFASQRADWFEHTPDFAAQFDRGRSRSGNTRPGRGDITSARLDRNTASSILCVMKTIGVSHKLRPSVCLFAAEVALSVAAPAPVAALPDEWHPRRESPRDRRRTRAVH